MVMHMAMHYKNTVFIACTASLPYNIIISIIYTLLIHYNIHWIQSSWPRHRGSVMSIFDYVNKASNNLIEVSFRLHAHRGPRTLPWSGSGQHYTGCVACRCLHSTQPRISVSLV